MRRLLPVLLPGAAALLAGCGGAEPVAAGPDRVLRVQLSEYRLEPQDWTVTEGRIRLVATNAGRLTHNLAVTEIEREIGEERTVYVRTDPAQPGQTVEDAVTLGPGRYRLLCTIGNHDELGQYGELRVLAQESGR
jgi:uncharacterized cupredoxin-like copper-binding protein